MVNNYRWRTFGDGSGFGEQLRSGIIVSDIDEICTEMWMHTKLGTFAENCGKEGSGFKTERQNGVIKEVSLLVLASLKTPFLYWH